MLIHQRNHKREEYFANAVMMDAPTKQWKINSVGFMGLRVILTNVAIKVVPIIQEEGEFALNMVQKLRSRFVVMKDVPTKLSATMFAGGTEESNRRSILADTKVVPIIQEGEEEFASNTVQKLRSRFVVMKDVQT